MSLEEEEPLEPSQSRGVASIPGIVMEREEDIQGEVNSRAVVGAVVEDLLNRVVRKVSEIP